MSNLLPWVAATIETFNGRRSLEKDAGIAIVTGEAVPANIKVGELRKGLQMVWGGGCGGGGCGEEGVGFREGGVDQEVQ